MAGITTMRDTEPFQSTHMEGFRFSYIISKNTGSYKIHVAIYLTKTTIYTVPTAFYRSTLIRIKCVVVSQRMGFKLHADELLPDSRSKQLNTNAASLFHFTLMSVLCLICVGCETKFEAAIPLRLRAAAYAEKECMWSLDEDLVAKHERSQLDTKFFGSSLLPNCETKPGAVCYIRYCINPNKHSPRLRFCTPTPFPPTYKYKANRAIYAFSVILMFTGVKESQQLIISSKQHVLQPTHSENPILDIIFTPHTESQAIDVTDRCMRHRYISPLLDHMQTSCGARPSEKEGNQLQTTEESGSAFADDLSRVLSTAGQENGIEALARTYKKISVAITDKHAPTRDGLKPWYNDEIYGARKQRRRLHGGEIPEN
ncbi:hypothetical protein CAPTEDRAFT_207023 [Capitella teleta]|uniref:Uncharacterized protein n=1 Tax=Capitella teleta TaxID=283909 RepID=R7URX1_CAPTE|nr:hypothetical protein CAPTEDRAFT_207023 [Capitella teleta]|eukprot:ELU08945.1 hypothetical protein CAPTEDRAFT_207023 [Capitella teleta]